MDCGCAASRATRYSMSALSAALVAGDLTGKEMRGYAASARAALGGRTMSDRASGLLLGLALVAATLGLVPTELRAQTCGLDQAVPPGQVDAASSTRFVPAGGYGE